jgi:hypothetical protein
LAVKFCDHMYRAIEYAFAQRTFAEGYFAMKYEEQKY